MPTPHAAKRTNQLPLPPAELVRVAAPDAVARVERALALLLVIGLRNAAASAADAERGPPAVQ